MGHRMEQLWHRVCAFVLAVRARRRRLASNSAQQVVPPPIATAFRRLDIERLVDMGFSAMSVQHALHACSGRVDDAAVWLLDDTNLLNSVEDADLEVNDNVQVAVPWLDMSDEDTEVPLFDSDDTILNPISAAWDELYCYSPPPRSIPEFQNVAFNAREGNHSQKRGCSTPKMSHALIEHNRQMNSNSAESAEISTPRASNARECNQIHKRGCNTRKMPHALIEYNRQVGGSSAEAAEILPPSTPFSVNPVREEESEAPFFLSPELRQGPDHAMDCSADVAENQQVADTTPLLGCGTEQHMCMQVPGTDGGEGHALPPDAAHVSPSSSSGHARLESPPLVAATPLPARDSPAGLGETPTACPQVASTTQGQGTPEDEVLDDDSAAHHTLVREGMQESVPSDDDREEAIEDDAENGTASAGKGGLPVMVADASFEHVPASIAASGSGDLFPDEPASEGGHVMDAPILAPIPSDGSTVGADPEIQPDRLAAAPTTGSTCGGGGKSLELKASASGPVETPRTLEIGLPPTLGGA